MKRVALCVGVDQYHDEDINNLGCASRDAEVTAFTLQQHGFDAVRITHGVTPQAVYDHLRKVAAHLAPGDVFVFFFAGHGKTHKQHGGKADQLFLLPDANATLLAEGNLAAAPGLLSWRTLMTLTDRWPGVQRLFIFDACRLPLQPADPGMRGRAASLAAPVQFEGAGVFRDFRLGRAPGPLAAAVGCTVLNSCSEGQQAKELPQYPGGGRGMFTAALIEELQEAGRAGYALATDALFGRRLHGRMQRLGQQHGAKGVGQQPLLVGEPVPLLLAAAAPPAGAPTPAPGALLAELLDNFERQFNAGQLIQPPRDCCQYTLGRLEAAGMREATLVVYARRLQQATPVAHAPVASARPAVPEPAPTQARSNPSRFIACGDACPVENVSWDDISGPNGFLVKLNKLTGQKNRLPSEAEWEFAARAGTETPFWWGGWISANQANYNSSGGYTGAGSADWLRMARADAFEANSWGLYNVHGNVWEWVQDCWHKGYKGAPNTGRAWETGCTTAAPYQSQGTRTDGPSRVLRGGSLLDEPRELRVTGRMVTGPDDRDNSSGFRIARTP